MTTYVPSDVLQTVFEPDSFCSRYRIPAICYGKDRKTLLIFAELRAGSADESAKHLVMRRGVLQEEPIKFEWNNITEVKEAHLDGHRSMNPCPVYDEKNKKLFLFFICVEGNYSESWQKQNYCNKAHLCYITSEDFGQSWCPVTDLTPSLPEHCVTFAVGPGHGLQTKDGSLMIVPAYCYIGVSPEQPVPYAVPLYSSDGGETWQFGSMLQIKSIECQMAEVWINDKTLIYCNARNEGGFRVEAFSEDKENLSMTPVTSGMLAETDSGCQGSVVSFPEQSEAAAESDEDQIQNKWLLFTHPSSWERNWIRLDLGVYLNKSPSDPKAWSEAFIINKGLSGYSDLAYIGGGWFACLFEFGKGNQIKKIALRFFNYTHIKPGTSDNVQPPDDKKCCNFL